MKSALAIVLVVPALAACGGSHHAASATSASYEQAVAHEVDLGSPAPGDEEPSLFAIRAERDRLLDRCSDKLAELRERTPSASDALLVAGAAAVRSMVTPASPTDHTIGAPVIGADALSLRNAFSVHALRRDVELARRAVTRGELLDAIGRLHDDCPLQ